MTQEQAPHPCAVAWERLVEHNEMLAGAMRAGNEGVYRQLLVYVRRRAALYLAALDDLLTELGE